MKYLLIFLFISCASNNQCLPIKVGQTVVRIENIGEGCFSYTTLTGHVTCNNPPILKDY